jgi:peroxiredoxin Q/BCP
MRELNEGDKSPVFSGFDQNGNEIVSENYSDKNLILFFYPKDNTPGCTKEACNLRDNYDLLLSKGFSIIGVSADDQIRHQKFIDKYSLPFPLIADIDKKVINAFGCWGPKKFMGKEYDGIHRKTFVIESGIITKIFHKVKTNDHTNQILNEL